MWKAKMIKQKKVRKYATTKILDLYYAATFVIYQIVALFFNNRLPHDCTINLMCCGLYFIGGAAPPGFNIGKNSRERKARAYGVRIYKKKIKRPERAKNLTDVTSGKICICCTSPNRNFEQTCLPTIFPTIKINRPVWLCLVSSFSCTISYLESRISYLVSRISYLVSHISHLVSRISHLASRISHLASRISLLVTRIYVVGKLAGIDRNSRWKIGRPLQIVWLITL